MSGVLFALAAATAWAAGAVVARLGLQHVGSLSATFLSLVSSLFVLLAIALVVDGKAVVGVPLAALPWIAFTGLLSFVLGRLFNYMSLSYIGVARATPLFGLAPFFATGLAVLLFQERVTPLLLLGTGSIMAGVTLIATGR